MCMRISLLETLGTLSSAQTFGVSGAADIEHLIGTQWKTKRWSSEEDQAIVPAEVEHDETGYIHNGEGWMRQTCRPQQGTRRSEQVMELCNSMNPTQSSGNQFKEGGGAAGNRNAGEMELAWYYTGAPAGITAKLFGLRPRQCWPKYSYCWKRCLRFGTCEEYVGKSCLRHLRPAIGPTTISQSEQRDWMRQQWEKAYWSWHLFTLAWSAMCLSA